MTIATYEFRPREVVVRRKITNKRLMILDKVINSPRGITADELEIRLGLRSNTVSAALSAMVKTGMIVDSGEKRATRSGRKATVYLRRMPKRK